MNDTQLKAAIDKFVKTVTFSAQREIEKAVRSALASGLINDGDSAPTEVTVSSEKLALNITIHKRLEL